MNRLPSLILAFAMCFTLCGSALATGTDNFPHGMTKAEFASQCQSLNAASADNNRLSDEEIDMLLYLYATNTDSSSYESALNNAGIYIYSHGQD